MQLMNMHNAELDEAGYLQVIRSKTAKLFEASARVGAILAGAHPPWKTPAPSTARRWARPFRSSTTCWTMQATAAVMGKSLGDDLREGKATLPLIAAMQRGSPAQRALIRRRHRTR